MWSFIDGRARKRLECAQSGELSTPTNGYVAWLRVHGPALSWKARKSSVRRSTSLRDFGRRTLSQALGTAHIGGHRIGLSKAMSVSVCVQGVDTQEISRRVERTRRATRSFDVCLTIAELKRHVYNKLRCAPSMPVALWSQGQGIGHLKERSLFATHPWSHFSGTSAPRRHARLDPYWNRCGGSCS